MRRNTTTHSLVLAELAVGALALFYYFSLRVRILSAFDAYGTRVPPLTRIAISPSFIPIALALSTAATVLAMVLPIKRSRSIRLAQLAVTVLACAVVFAILAALVPMFNP
jgi:hypothetical protein